jgi:glycosyltransferase involved in cell wall biosynthesis
MKPRIRILHVIDSFDLGGGQTALLNLLRAANRDRYEVEVACMHGRGIFWEEFGKLGVPVHSLSPRKWLPLYIPRLITLIRERRFEIVHSHLFGANWIAKPIAALLGVPVRINHDQCNDALRYDNPLARAIDTFTNRWSSHICAVSKSTREFLIDREGLLPERVSLVYNGVDLERFVPSETRAGHQPFVVVGVGRLHPQKNFALFLEVAQQLAGLEFRIAGTGPEEPMLRGLAASLGIAERVKFLGHVSDTRSLYADGDVLLMTSRFEGTPLTVLEAMAMRLPIVAPRLDGIGEILNDGEDALLVDPPVRDGFVAALARLIAEPALARSLAASAEVKVRTGFSAEAMARQVEEIYERSLARETHEIRVDR